MLSFADDTARVFGCSRQPHDHSQAFAMPSRGVGHPPATKCLWHARKMGKGERDALLGSAPGRRCCCARYVLLNRKWQCWTGCCEIRCSAINATSTRRVDHFNTSACTEFVQGYSAMPRREIVQCVLIATCELQSRVADPRWAYESRYASPSDKSYNRAAPSLCPSGRARCISALPLRLLTGDRARS